MEKPIIFLNLTHSPISQAANSNNFADIVNSIPFYLVILIAGLFFILVANSSQINIISLLVVTLNGQTKNQKPNDWVRIITFFIGVFLVVIGLIGGLIVILNSPGVSTKGNTQTPSATSNPVPTPPIVATTASVQLTTPSSIVTTLPPTLTPTFTPIPEAQIKNGDFALGPDPDPNNGGVINLDKGDLRAPGQLPFWTITRGSIDYISAAYWEGPRKSTLRSINLTNNGGIAQTISTVGSVKYLLSFWLAGNTNGSPELKKLGVTAASSTQTYQFDVSGKDHQNMGWELHNLEFTAVSDSTIIEFYSLTNENNRNGPVIADISIKNE